MDEVNDLRSEDVWDESSVAEWSEVRHIKKDGFTPMSGLIFIIMGQKNAELSGKVPDDQISLLCQGCFPRFKCQNR